ncbi:formyl-CoA transferase [Thermocatellispora tengchongensis]|uniref:Formyl-CoA transferase n=1 Tax=Thermocatellispora tengchongensis TaxID=1073253 RepID=A0A840PI82_9ACTN|nr:CoA transferase [Thermocatellispora tengchongensis]MBB5135785.1 formyl-CoA transferase [Thermocatellispora tengchongensis]
MTARPLDGVLVADFSRVLAGPLCTMTLADLGATVIKVERPGAGDDTRAWGPPWTAAPQGSSTYFESVNRSKHSVALDLDDPGDLALARELARRADVLVENFKPGALERRGLGYAQVAEANPRVVYCSVSGFGGGAGAARPGYDFIAQAVGGLMSITGEADGEPMKAGVALVDVLTGKDAAIGVLAALAARERTGRGCRIEVNLLSSLLAALVNQAQGYLETGVPPRRMGNRHPSIAPYETLRCRDGLLAVACGNDGQFARFAAVLGEPGLAADERFATNAARVEHREELVAALEALLAAAGAAEWEERLAAVQVPAGRVGDLAAGFALAERLGLAPAAPPAPGRAPQVRHPVTYSADLVRPPQPPPGLGEHDAAVRAWLAAGPAPFTLEGHDPE